MPRVMSIVGDTIGSTPSFKQKLSHRKMPRQIKSDERGEDKSYSWSEEGSEGKEYSDCLNYSMSSLFGIILEDTLTQLRILGETNNELRIIKTKLDWNRLLSLKFDVKQSDCDDEAESIDPKRLDCDEYKIEKLDADRYARRAKRLNGNNALADARLQSLEYRRRVASLSVLSRMYLDECALKYVGKVITSTYAELCLERTFSGLEEHINTKITLNNRRQSLIEEEASNRALRRELNRQLRQQRNHQKSIAYDTDIKIDALKTHVEDSVLVLETKTRYTSNWENSRMEQHVQAINDTESVKSNLVQYYKQRMDNEQRVHMEVELLFNIHINETLQQIENWMDKYDRDIEDIDLKIQIKRCAYQDMLANRINLEETIVRHAEEIKNWVTFKDQRAKAIEYRDTMTKSAIIVQAWWRGLLVRLQMGPYRVARREKVKLAGAAAAAMIKKSGK